jgi:hypothetical protein
VEITGAQDLYSNLRNIWRFPKIYQIISKRGNQPRPDMERLRTRSFDVQPQNQLGEGSIVLAKNLNINGNAKTGRTDEQIVLYAFFAGCSLKCPPTEVLSMASERLKALG